MCGIVGIFAYGTDAPPASREEVIRIRDSMLARGPDHGGYWDAENAHIAFGHRRLSIIAVDASGNQPMVLEETGTSITFNGEIYNYRDVRRTLEQRGRRFRTESDTEVLLQAYEEFGPKMVEHLRGMYAFAIWDARRKGLFLARDPMGIKPLYYCDDGETFRFASQLRALLAGDVESAIDPAGVVSFFLLGYVAEPFTFRRSIHPLLPGHTMWVGARGPETPRAFFSLRDILMEAEGAADQAPGGRSLAEIAATIRQSVAAHMVADVPVGVFLSAGLDSTSIASLAVGMTNAPLRTITLAFKEFEKTERDEAPIAEEVGRAFNTQHNTLRVEGKDFTAARDKVLQAMDQPTHDGVNTYFVSKAAAELGLKVALSGLGGDELFRGYVSFQQVPAISRALHPFGAMPSLGRGVRMVSSHLVARFTSPKYAGILEYGTNLEDAYLLRRALYMPWELPNVLDPDLVRAGWARLRPIISLRESTAGLRRDHSRMTVLEMNWYMRNQLLRDTDWAGMAHSIEVRPPLVDAELIRQLAPMLVAERAPDRRTVAAALPIGTIKSVMTRAKTGFGVPVREWLLGEEAAGPSDRGLRGWAKMVYAYHASL
jgi:asparagine synthase (glutamine-hydrolysing)